EVHALREERSALADIRGGDAERKSRREPHDSLDLPSTKRVGRGAAVGQPRLPGPERQLVTEARLDTVSLIVPRVSGIGIQIPRVGGVVRLDFAGSVVAAPRQLVAAEKEQPVGVAFVDA